ncbi:two pore domain potassium channel family protein [Thalassotalea litorea]|uniref:Two pore domain potassium channel family protein n=1 Tax=Thalassotalea litorea TaxID=2020715 RepID=A0A5R9IVL3_9GAMM|nr:potassium channel family protein [Thalassotalea litorea]TLU67216.1 two pore domain potassium channel family protein [Thalassotalea litorea]
MLPKIRKAIPAWVKILSSGLCLAAVFLLCLEIMVIYGQEEERLPGWISYLVNLLFYGVILIWIARLIYIFIYLFQQDVKNRVLADLAATYLSTIIVFSSGYYLISSLADYRHYVNEYHHYQTLPKHFQDIEYPYNTRGFVGINHSMFMGVSELVDDIEVKYGQPASASQKWQAVHNLEDVFLPQYNSEKRSLYFLECFYFSVVTVTTLGYGDITPNFWFVKIAASIQSLLGVAIVAVGFGLIVNRIRQKEQIDCQERQ